jgi:hypothetical protein
MVGMHAPAVELHDVGTVSATGCQRRVFLFETIGITVQHWRERTAVGDELGARIELQRLEQLPGSHEFHAWELRLYDPLFRADLFRLSTGLPGNFDRAHYHPRFNGREAHGRVFDPELTADPASWLERRLFDLPGLLEQAGHPELADEADVRRVREALPSIVVVVREFLDVLPEASPVPGSAALTG